MKTPEKLDSYATYQVCIDDITNAIYFKTDRGIYRNYKNTLSFMDNDGYSENITHNLAYIMKKLDRNMVELCKGIDSGEVYYNGGWHNLAF